MDYLHKYIGIPYKAKGTTIKGLDCIGLIEMIYENEFNIKLPDHARISADDKELCSEHLVDGSKKWERIMYPEPNCVIIFNIGGYPLHTGMVLDNKRMIHSLKGHNSAIESYVGAKWGSRIEGFYKWQSM